MMICLRPTRTNVIYISSKITELKDAVYNIAVGKDTFTKMTRKIAKYVSCQHDDTSKSRIGMEQLELTPLTEPTPPTADASVVILELWKIARRVYEKKLKAWNRNSGQAYAIALGQCFASSLESD
jgi:hypothetical protein